MYLKKHICCRIKTILHILFIYMDILDSNLQYNFKIIKKNENFKILIKNYNN